MGKQDNPCAVFYYLRETAKMQKKILCADETKVNVWGGVLLEENEHHPECKMLWGLWQRPALGIHLFCWDQRAAES